MCTPFDITNAEHKALLNRIIAGDVVLFLGSGFSMGAMSSIKDCTTGTYEPLPGVKELRKKLLSDVLNMDEAVDYSLKELCEECKADNLAKYTEFMKRFFTTSSICDFHNLYANIRWKQIFTINVDDIIEKAYQHSGELCCIHTAEPVYAKPEALKYYKLHGCAVQAPADITFSYSDYIVNAATGFDCRFEALRNALKTDNFLFIGTSLNEEWDIDIKCEQANIYRTTNKAYFLLKDYDALLVKKIKRKFTNLVFIQETAASFIHKIIAYKKNNTIMSVQTYDRWNLRRIQKNNFNVEGYLKPDLYLGAEPTWEDIFTDHDVIWENTKVVIDNIKNGTNKTYFLIVDKPITGKTTLLYRIGAYLTVDYDVLEYDGEEFIQDLRNFISDIREVVKPFYLLIDDSSWFTGRIHDILNIIDGTNVKIITTIREKEYRKRQHLFDEESINQGIEIIEGINHLTKKDLGLYLDKLNEKSFLGIYANDYQQDRNSSIEKLYKYIKNQKEDPLLLLAYSIKYGSEPLEKRIDKIGKDVIDNNNYNIKRFSVLLYFLDVIGDIGLKLSLFLDLYPMQPNEQEMFLLEISDLLLSNANQQSWKNSEYKKIVLHSRFSRIIQNVVKKIPLEELEAIVEDIFRRLNATHHYQSRKPDNYYNYVLYTMLRTQNVSELFRIGSRNGKIEWRYISRLYKNLHTNYSDYHLYWLHRGIAEVKMHDFPSATIHLDQANSVRNGYSYEIEHAYAGLYFERAMYDKDLPPNEREEMLNSALRIMRKQIDRRENDAFSIHSFVVKTIQCYNKFNKLVPDELLNEMFRYFETARMQFSLERSTMMRNLLNCIYTYLKQHNRLYRGRFKVTQEELQYLLKRTDNDEMVEDLLDLI